MAPLIVTGLVGLVKTWLTNKAEKQQAVHAKDIATINNTASWEQAQAENAGNSWKDEWFTIVFSVPLLGAFIPSMVPYIEQGFIVLNGMPDYYKGFLGAAVAASFGLRAVSKWGKN